MTASDALNLLLRLTLASSVSIVLVLVLRKPVRALFGAGVAWPVWLIVPTAMLAAALPSVRVQQQLVVALSPIFKVPALSAPVSAADALHWTFLVLALWLAGTIAAVIVFARAQRDFMARVGVLTPRDGIWYADRSSEGPALLGLIKPKIVVPADFDTRYDASEQALIIAHERRHAERGDPLANAAIALLRCLFWFNPLVHVAAARCRFDQELACDADVMQRLPGRIKAYAGAMLKTQVGSAAALATCHWQSSHPLKERIMQLNQPAPAAARRLAGRILIAGLLCASAMGAVVARADTSIAAAGLPYEVTLEMTSMQMKYKTMIDAPGFMSPAGKSMRLLVPEGEHFTVSSEQPGGIMEGEFVISDAGSGSVSIRVKLKNNNILVGEPRILAKLGATSAVAIGGKDDSQSYKVSLTVNLANKPTPGS